MIKNSYLDIAQNDLEYLETVLKTGNTFYNQLAVQCQQVAEKFLKGYLDNLLIGSVKRPDHGFRIKIDAHTRKDFLRLIDHRFLVKHAPSVPYFPSYEQIFVYCQIIYKIEFLMYECDSGIKRFPRIRKRDFLPINLDRTLIRGNDSTKYIHQCALACAILTH